MEVKNKKEITYSVWQELYCRIMDEADCCAQGQYCPGNDTYIDATARMEAYNHVLDIMKEMEKSSDQKRIEKRA